MRYEFGEPILISEQFRVLWCIKSEVASYVRYSGCLHVITVNETEWYCSDNEISKIDKAKVRSRKFKKVALWYRMRDK